MIFPPTHAFTTVAFALMLLGPHKAVAVEPADRPARVKHMDVRVFLQDKDVL